MLLVNYLLLSIAVRDELCNKDRQHLTQGTVLVSHEVIILKWLILVFDSIVCVYRSNKVIIMVSLAPTLENKTVLKTDN